MDWKSRRITTLLTALCISISCSTAFAQTNSAPTPASPALTAAPAFEVATVKPIDPTLKFHMHTIKIEPGGRINFTVVSVRDLIRLAFNVEDWQISGLDGWMSKEAFDLQAEAAETTPPTTYSLRHTYEHISDEHLRQMLQALLIDRFHLKFHPTTATGLVFLLEKSGKPVHLVPVEETSSKPKRDMNWGWLGIESDPHEWLMSNMSMPEFASYASREFLNRPVIDRTGLQGSFDFHWNIVAASPDQQQGNDNDTFPLLIQAMGLKLTKSTGPVDTFVIDHVERPTAN